MTYLCTFWIPPKNWVIAAAKWAALRESGYLWLSCLWIITSHKCSIRFKTCKHAGWDIQMTLFCLKKSWVAWMMWGHASFCWQSKLGCLWKKWHNIGCHGLCSLSLSDDAICASWAYVLEDRRSIHRVQCHVSPNHNTFASPRIKFQDILIILVMPVSMLHTDANIRWVDTESAFNTEEDIPLLWVSPVHVCLAQCSHCRHWRRVKTALWQGYLQWGTTIANLHYIVLLFLCFHACFPGISIACLFRYESIHFEAN